MCGLKNGFMVVSTEREDLRRGWIGLALPRLPGLSSDGITAHSTGVADVAVILL